MLTWVSGFPNIYFAQFRMNWISMKRWVRELFLPQYIFLRNLFPTCKWGRRAHSTSQNHSWKNTDLVNEGKIPMLFSFGTESDYLYTHTQTKKCTHTHTSVSQPPAQMLISTAVFLCVWTSFMMMLQRANQTSLQCETHTYTLIQAQMSLLLYSSHVNVCVCS